MRPIKIFDSNSNVIATVTKQNQDGRDVYIDEYGNEYESFPEGFESGNLKNTIQQKAEKYYDDVSDVIEVEPGF